VTSSVRPRQDEADRRALVDRLAATLQSRVLSGQIATGSRLRQEVLAAEFGVSRTPVREALRKLQATGIVELEPHRGALVRGPTARDIREAYEVRAELEGLAAELAARHIADGQLRRLREAERLFRHSIEMLLARRRRDPDGEPPWEDDTEWVRANDLFHQAVQEAAGNRRLLATIADLHQTFPRSLTWSALSESSRLLQENVDQHHGILDAIERHDPARARSLMAAHVRRAGDLVARRFEQAVDGATGT
jgi:DNA-binding GntR family transcriptional regulator